MYLPKILSFKDSRWHVKHEQPESEILQMRNPDNYIQYLKELFNCQLVIKERDTGIFLFLEEIIDAVYEEKINEKGQNDTNPNKD